jgi:hypothetical protein
MPNLAEFRSTFSTEAGPYIGPETYVVRATSGSTETQLVSSAYPIRSGMAISSSLLDRPIYRPTAALELDRNRYVMTYDPPSGTITPDLPWATAMFFSDEGNTYADLENYTYADLEGFPVENLYEDLEGVGEAGIGERFEILGPFDAPTTHRLLNDGLKQCWLIVEVACQPADDSARHNLGVVANWLQDTLDVLQVGYLAEGEDRNAFDPFERIVQGQVERDGGDFYLNTGMRTFKSTETLYLRCLKRAYDHCRPVDGFYGQQSGLLLETDEAPVEREWLCASALTIAWRRFGHMLEPLANQRLIRDQQTAAAWFSDETRKHFSAPLPARTLHRKRQFGPVAMTY